MTADRSVGSFTVAIAVYPAETMHVTDVSARVLRIPIDIPLLDEPLSQTVVLVAVETDAGETGYGETGMSTPGATARYVEAEMAPLLEGADPVATDAVWERLRARLNRTSDTGIWSTAVSAVDHALWDLKGKALGEPVWRLLGGARETVPAYVTFGLSEYDVEQLVEAATGFVDRGADALKMVVGRDTTIPEDAERVRAVREAVGEAVDLMIDGNRSFAPAEAVELCHRVEDCHLSWFEEPVTANEVALLRDLRSRTRVPVAVGQNEGNRYAHRRLIEAGAVDVIQPNVCFCGGYTEAARVAATAGSFNVPVANGGAWPFHNMHLHAGVADGGPVELHDLVWKADDRLYEWIPGLEDGTLTLPEEPGLGLEPDPDRVAAFAVDA